MKARITTDAITIFDFFRDQNQTCDWIESHADAGGYYAPDVDRGERIRRDTRNGGYVSEKYIRITFPNSTLFATANHITVEGKRGSIEDCIAPFLRECRISVEAEQWIVDSLRPDVPWYMRAGAVEV